MRPVLRASLAVVTATLLVAGPATAGSAATGAASPAVSVDAGLAKLLMPQFAGVAMANGRLYLNGQPHFFTGVNAYNATTDWSVNWGCGAAIGDLNVLFGAMPQHSLVRTWAFQALGFNNHTTQAIDFSAIDRVVAAAKAHHDFLILTLSDQAGVCDDGHFHDAAWYAGGYTRTYNDDGRGLAKSMSYLQWVKAVVKRYRGNRTVAVYEPVNEPEASNCNPGVTGGACYGNNSCPADATRLLRQFFDRIGAVIKGLDSRALVSTGTMGESQCGVAGNGFRRITASRYVDITTLHDYGYPSIADANGLLLRAAQATALGKAFLVEEAGIDASASGAGCMTIAERAAYFRAKARTDRRAGGDGYLPWFFSESKSSDCSQELAPGDPVLLHLLG